MTGLPHDHDVSQVKCLKCNYPAKQVGNAEFWCNKCGQQIISKRENGGIEEALYKTFETGFFKPPKVETQYPNLASSEIAERQDNKLIITAIPAYNEGNTISDIVTSAKKYSDIVIVIDDGSSDDTADKAKEAGAIVIKHHRNSGYGAVLKRAFKEAIKRSAEHLVIIDADGQHDPSDIPKLINEQRKNNADLVIGSRFKPGSETNVPLYRKFGIFVINILMNLTMGRIQPSLFVTDTQSGFRAYSRSIIKSLVEDNSISNGMDASVDILFHAHQFGYSISEIPTTVEYEVDDPNSKNPISHGLTLVHSIFQKAESQHPIILRGTPSLISILIGIGMAKLAFQSSIEGNALISLVGITSIIFLLVGIIGYLSVIKRYYNIIRERSQEINVNA